MTGVEMFRREAAAGQSDGLPIDLTNDPEMEQVGPEGGAATRRASGEGTWGSRRRTARADYVPTAEDAPDHR